MGTISRFLDIYTEHLGNMLSQMAIWIFFGTLISIYSESQKKAMLNILTFCIGMLITYYLTAVSTNGVYNSIFITGWSVFTVFTPLFAYFTWLTKEKGVFPKIISMGVVMVSVMSSIIVFHNFRLYDFIINAFLIYFLFIKKIKRQYNEK